MIAASVNRSTRALRPWPLVTKPSAIKMFKASRTETCAAPNSCAQTPFDDFLAWSELATKNGFTELDRQALLQQTGAGRGCAICRGPVLRIFRNIAVSWHFDFEARF